MTQIIENETEKCVRCGKEDEDLRTLWMSCFYKMDENKSVPYEKTEVLEAHHYKEGEHIPTILNEVTRLPFTKEGNDGTLVITKRTMFTLRVCKVCRAEWMGSISAWFKKPPVIERNLGSGIFIKVNGATVEVTEEEYEQMYPGRVPVTYKPF
jgi:hypothetical protein